MDIKNEIAFFDKEAEALLNARDEELIVENPYKHLAGSKIAFDYLLDRMGDVSGKTILDVGCGDGWFSVYLAQKGANMVHGFDVSPNMVKVAERRASVNRVENSVSFSVNTAENLHFADGTFDLVVGISVMHHINLDTFGQVIKKIMKKDGKAVFIEPLGESKLGEFIRNTVMLKLLSKRTEDEEPLKLTDIEKLQGQFALHHWEFQLFGSAARFLGDRAASLLLLNTIDGLLLKAFRSLRKQCRLTVIELTNR